MDSKDHASLNSKINTTITNIGYKNGTAAPASQDPLDAELHHLYTTTLVASVGKKMAEKQKKRVLEGVLTELQTKVIAGVGDDAVKNDMKMSAVIATGQHYALHLQCNKPADKLNTDKLFVELQTKHKMKLADVRKLFASCTEKAKPAHVYTVVPLTTQE